MPGGSWPVQARTMASGTWAATSARTSGSGRMVTSPAPARRAPRAAITAAPLMPGEAGPDGHVAEVLLVGVPAAGRRQGPLQEAQSGGRRAAEGGWARR